MSSLSLFSNPPPISPGVGARRKGPKSLPTLPLSAFSAPNSGISDSFPLPPSPSTVHPDRVVDASVRGSIPKWKAQATGSLASRVSAIVVKTSEGELEVLDSQASEAGVAILAVSVPFSLESGTVPSIPSTKYPVILSAAFSSMSDAAVAALRAALSAGHTVEIDVQGSIEESRERLEDLLTKATADGINSGLIVLSPRDSQCLPPPHDLELPIVKLLSHSTYLSYQSHVATLSLFPRVYISYVPPTWNAPTPPTPLGQDSATASKEKKEWKRRIKMYCKFRAVRLSPLQPQLTSGCARSLVGPAVEAFGFERIIFGSAPSSSSHAHSSAGDWYEIAREAFAELGVEQNSVDAVFGGNAQRIFSTSTSGGQA
ncbi:hypothetical protein BC826DRAFT_984593 [Russula brevipes]|nr:hypothetical protein BC826DRAFT_984593 [Russula brevipes]